MIFSDRHGRRQTFSCIIGWDSNFEPFPGMSELTILTAEDVEACGLTYQQLHQPLSEVMQEFSRGELEQPLRTRVKLPQGLFFTMPACIPSKDIVSVKTVSVINGNKDIGLPSHISNIQLFSASTGRMLVTMPADEITAKRTAVMSAIASKRFANPDSKIMCVLGAGVQARHHILALRECFKLTEVRIWNHNFGRAKALSDELDCIACKTVEEAAAYADIICTVTSSSVPVLFKSYVQEGCHINSVGAPAPTMREISDDLMKHSDLVVIADSVEGAMKESGDVIHSGYQVKHELGKLLGDKEWDRNDKQHVKKITMFKNLGMACQDGVVAKMVFSASRLAYGEKKLINV